MKYVFALLVIFSGILYAQNQNEPKDLRGILLEQLHSTHDAEGWFVDGNTAIAGLTPEQASWSDGKGNHSVGQLTRHLVYWNRYTLKKLKGESQEKFNGNNDETFTAFDAKRWSETQQQFDQVMKEWESLVQGADDKNLQEWASTIAKVGTHNAYHIGQIIVVRREQGAWKPR